MSLRILAAIPAHAGTIAVETAETLVLVQQMILRRGGTFRVHFEQGATISLVRNALAAEFLASDADLMLMLDADQAVHPDTIERMIDLVEPVVGCIYPARGYDWSKVDVSRGADPKQLLNEALRFVGRLIADERGESPVVDGFARAEHVGTGIMLLRREAFTAMMTRHPELQGRGFGADAYPRYNGGGRWGFFNPRDNSVGVPLSEDISFCLRWRETGGDIWADVSSTTLHVGRYMFAGSLLEQSSALQGRGAAAALPPPGTPPEPDHRDL
jgi:hypothetical protein